MSSRSSTGSFDLAGARVLVMGLGAHGGGAASARFCAEAGASVTVTDLRDESALGESVASLADLPIRFVLGRHDAEDFRIADIVVKNPAVPRTAPLLREARRIETDISIFLAGHAGPILAVTGTKGKSTAASALHHVIAGRYPNARLGGNITVSPLTFAHELDGDEPVVLELSSFQLGDLLLTPAGVAGGRPSFRIAAVTNLLPDHQDYYDSMQAYAADKALIFAGQQRDQWCLLSDDDAWSRSYRPPHPSRVVRFTAGTALPPAGAAAGFDRDRGVLRLDGEPPLTLVPHETTLSGRHMRMNLLYAGVGAHLFGIPADEVRRRTASFAGVPHRLEVVAVDEGVRYVNDSAATIAEAALAAIESFDAPVHLIAGGSDKGLPLDAFAEIAGRTASLHLLEGTATRRIMELLEAAGGSYSGPYESLEAAFSAARAAARAGEVVLLSPGCASFGMFRNEFDRGNRFRDLVQSRPGMVP